MHSDGRIIRLTWQAEILCILLALDDGAQELFYIQFLGSDDRSATLGKSLLTKLAAIACASRRPVEIEHDENGAAVRSIAFSQLDLSPIDAAVRGDCYALSGKDFDPDLKVVFENDHLSVAVTPDIVRPHWLLIETLPHDVPLGPVRVHLRGPLRFQGISFRQWTTQRVPIFVSSGPPAVRRTLYSGRAATMPYTIAFAASPAIEIAGASRANEIMVNRATFRRAVRRSLTQMLTLEENLLRADGIERDLRLVAIFDTLPSRTLQRNALVSGAAEKVKPMAARQQAFVSGYWEEADVIFAVSSDATYWRSTALPTVDREDGNGVDFTFDGTTHTHYRHCSQPGTVALEANLQVMTAVHEFLHAASSTTQGRVRDLYEDGSELSSLVVNKKFRTKASDPVPSQFGQLDGVTYSADPTRDGLGYEATWRSYHPQLRNAAAPNLMDDYREATDPEECQLDRLTFEWYRARLKAKARRGT